MSQFVPVFCVRRDVLLKNRVDWNAVNTDVAELGWCAILSCDDPMTMLNEALLEIVHRRVRVTSVCARSNDRPWFDGDCRRVFDRNRAAYFRWSNARTRVNWDAFVAVRTEADIVYCAAQDRFNARTAQKLSTAVQPHAWWSTLKGAIFNPNSSVPPLSSPSGAMLSDPKEKADLLIDHFDSKQSRNVVQLPPPAIQNLRCVPSLFVIKRFSIC